MRHAITFSLCNSRVFEPRFNPLRITFSGLSLNQQRLHVTSRTYLSACHSDLNVTPSMAHLVPCWQSSHTHQLQRCQSVCRDRRWQRWLPPPPPDHWTPDYGGHYQGKGKGIKAVRVIIHFLPCTTATAAYMYCREGCTHSYMYKCKLLRLHH